MILGEDNRLLNPDGNEQQIQTNPKSSQGKGICSREMKFTTDLLHRKRHIKASNGDKGTLRRNRMNVASPR